MKGPVNYPKAFKAAKAAQEADRKKKINSQLYNCTIVVEGPTAVIEGTYLLEPVQEATSFYTPGYQFTQKYKMGYWDGRTKLFHRGRKTFPAGLADDVADALEGAGCQVTIDDRRNCPGDADTSQRSLEGVSFDYPYDFQPECALALVRGQRGIAAVATNGGKCLGLGTLVLKYDGSTCRVEDVLPGDLLMGPDSQPRRVLSTTRGSGPLYKIIPNKGDPWVCNDVHVLTLKHTETGEVIDIPLDQYLDETPNFRHLHKQFTTGVDFPAPAQLPLDPYFLAVWFGDGTKDLSLVAVTKDDPEIKDLMEEVAQQFGAQVNTQTSNGTRCANHRIVTERGKPNPLLDLLREVVGPHMEVPHEYLTASREDRLKFLAGWLDTDGHLHKNNSSYEITQKRLSYIVAVAYVARSLGYRATFGKPKVVDGVRYFRLGITGDFSELPIRIERKKPPKIRKRKTDPTRTGFEVESIGEGSYVGFELSGDGRFLLGDFTVTHNTTIACLITKMLNLDTLFLVPNLSLLYQTWRVFQNRLGLSGEEVGLIGDGHWNTSQGITIATINTLWNRIGDDRCRDYLKKVQVVFADECFPAGTKVGGVPIDKINPGDLVPSFDDETGEFVKRRVVRKFVNRPSSLVRVSFGGRSLVPTPGHPFWTQRGWVPALFLTSDDMVLCSTQKQEIGDESSVLSLRKRNRTDKESRERGVFRLQEVFEEDNQDELRKVWFSNHSFDQCPVSSGQKGSRLLQRAVQEVLDVFSIFGGYAGHQFATSRFDLETNAKSESNVRPQGASEAESYSQGNGVETSHPWWKRKRTDCSGNAASVKFGVEHRSGGQDQEIKGIWVSPTLQDRHSQRRSDDRRRGGWGFSLSDRKAESGSEERRSFAWVRVDSVEVLKSTSDGTFGGLCPDGFVYNLEVEDTHTYLTEGVVVHNCHHVGSDTWYKVLGFCGAYYRFGLSGTPLKRTDGADLKLIGQTGRVLYEVKNKDLIERGISVKPYIHFIEINKPVIPRQVPWDEAYKRGIVDNPFRNKALCDKVQEFVDQGLSVLILVREIAHGEALDKKLWSYPKGSFCPHQFISGEESTEVREKALDEFREGKIKVLIATSILDEGVDIPNIDVLVLAGGGKSSIATLQRVGRGLRKGGNVDRLYIVDTIDFQNHHLLRHSMQRFEDYKAEECFEIEEISK